MNKKIVYSCSGCSSAAQMANWIAVEMDRQGVAEMSCISGVGGGVKSMVQKAQAADVLIGIDGCALRCVEACLRREGMACTYHFDLNEFGIKKKIHQDFDRQKAKETFVHIVRKIGNLV